MVHPRPAGERFNPSRRPSRKRLRMLVHQEMKAYARQRMSEDLSVQPGFPEGLDKVAQRWLREELESVANYHMKVSIRNQVDLAAEQDVEPEDAGPVVA